MAVRRTIEARTQLVTNRVSQETHLAHLNTGWTRSGHEDWVRHIPEEEPWIKKLCEIHEWPYVSPGTNFLWSRSAFLLEFCTGTTGWEGIAYDSQGYPLRVGQLVWILSDARYAALHSSSGFHTRPIPMNTPSS